jgi:hypothetical protein
MRMQAGDLLINHRRLSKCVKEMYVQGKRLLAPFDLDVKLFWRYPVSELKITPDWQA